MSRKSFSSREVVRLLEGHGFKLVRVRGGHHVFEHPETRRHVTVPHPKKDLPLGTVMSIFRHAGIEPPG